MDFRYMVTTLVIYILDSMKTISLTPMQTNFIHSIHERQRIRVLKTVDYSIPPIHFQLIQTSLNTIPSFILHLPQSPLRLQRLPPQPIHLPIQNRIRPIQILHHHLHPPN